jgi:hypothetical protein
VTDKDFCAKQIARFSGLINFPDSREAKIELVYALQAFETQQQAEKFVSDWIASETLTPLPAMIRKLAYAAQEEHAKKSASSDCPLCNGTGWAREIRRKRGNPSMPIREYEYAVPCKCGGKA